MGTPTCDQLKELLPAYAAGALNAEERAFVRAHLDGCPNCAQALLEFEAVAHGLPKALPERPAPAALRAKLLQAAQASIAAETAARRPTPIPVPTKRWLERLIALFQPRYLPRYGVALLVLLAAAYFVAPRRTAPADMTAEIIAGRTKAIAMKGTEKAPNATATMSLGADDRSAVIEVAGLPPLPEGKMYCAWLVYDGGDARDMGGLFSVDANGAGKLLITAPRSLATYGRFTVTEEQAGSKPEKPTGPR